MFGPVLSIALLAGAMYAVFVAIGYAAGADPLYYLRGSRVWLVDGWGEVYATRERIDRNGVKWAYVYPMSKIGHVVLFPDGSARGESNYVKSWSRLEAVKKPASRAIEALNARFISQ